MRVDEHEGAVEGDKITDYPQHGNENAQLHGALDEEGLPQDCDKIDEDVSGATTDDTQG